jgi:hypothetical protein
MFAVNPNGRARLALATALTMLPTADTLAHGFAGSRFFPATIVIDDPFVADELSLPTVSNRRPGPIRRSCRQTSAANFPNA